MKRILYYLGLIDLVWTIDHDGETRLRIVRHGVDGKQYACAICGMRDGPPCLLNNDGTITPTSGKSYMKRWVSYAAGRPRKHPELPLKYTMWKP